MNTIIKIAVALAAIVVISTLMRSAFAQNEWLRNTEVCRLGTLDAYATRSIGMGAVEHNLTIEETKTVIRVLYHRFMTPTHAKLFTHAERMPAIIFGDSHGCYMKMIRPRLDWISHILDRDIVHPVP